MKLTFDLLRQRALLLILFAVIAAMLLAPIGSNTMIPMILDYLNHLDSIIQAKAALAEGQFPLRVSVGDQNGWRYPYFQFYSSTSYFVASLIYRWLTPSNPFIAYKLTIWMAYVVGGIYMFRLSDWLVRSKPASILASVVYLTAPYNLIVINHMGGFNEAIALGILPAVIYYSLRRYYYPSQNKTLIQAAFVWYLLITVHLLTFICTSLFVAVMLLLITLKNHRHWMRLIEVGIAYVFGCFLAMWYLAPIAIYSKLFTVAHSFNSITSFNSYKPFLSSLLSPVANLVYTEREGGNGLVDIIARSNPAVGLFALAGVAICLAALWMKKSEVTRRMAYWAPVLLVLFFLGFLLSWSPGHFWERLPQSFRVIQYSWRFLGQTVWVGAILFAYALMWLFKGKLDEKHVAVGTLLVLITSGAWFPVVERNYTAFDEFLNHPRYTVNPDSYLIDAQQYLPAVNVIDSLVLDAANPMDHAYLHPLKLNSPYNISLRALSVASTPSILVKGRMPDKANLENALLTAYVNGVAVSTYHVRAGAFDWAFPLASSKEVLNTQHKVILTFGLSGVSGTNKLDVIVEKIVLNGMLNAKHTMFVDKAESFCSQQKQSTVCEIDVPKEVHFIELPVLFYPDLLQVTINGKVASYSSVLYQGRLITGVVPVAGAMNKIVMQFRGLPWANFMSKVTWYLWLFFLFYIVIKAIAKKGEQKKSASVNAYWIR